MKILMITAGMAGGGTERVISVLANYLAGQQYDVTILMTAGSEVVYKLDEKVKIACLGESTGGKIAKRIQRIRVLRHWYQKDQSQIIISFGTETNLFSILAGFLLSNSIIVSERNDPNQCSYKFIRNLIYRSADYFVFQTEEARKCFSGNIVEQKSVVISNPIKDNIPSPFEGQREKEIVAVGRLEAQKNHKLLIKAFSQFHRHMPNYKLIIYGIGELYAELQAFSKEMKMDKYIIFAGFSANIMEKIRQSAMYVLSSDYEGISNSLMEAMALGLPVISTDCPIGGSAMLIQDGINGCLVPVGDSEALADAMLWIAKNPVNAEKIGNAAQIVKEVYAANKICEQWLNVIKKFGNER